MSPRSVVKTVLLVSLGACTQTAGERLSIAVEGSGTTSPAGGTHSYASGTSVEVTATPAEGATFVGWSGAASGTADRVSVVMDGPKQLLARFSGGGGGGSGGGGGGGAGELGGGGGTAGGGGGSASGGGSGEGGGCLVGGGDGGTTVSINAGGEAMGGFAADGYASGGDSYSTTDDIDTSGIACNPPPAAVFQTERYGEFSYTLSRRAPGSTQTVTLYFEESYWTAAGQRTFDVAINGAKVLTAFDIFDAAGGADKAIAKAFTTAADDQGRVVIEFSRAGADNPKVSAITVVGEAAATPDGGSGGAGPCDLYEAGGTPCVAAHSTVRALYGDFSGHLYQVQRASDQATKDIPVLVAGGFADSAQQDAFCANTTCVISKIYDQSPRANHLTPAPGGSGIHTPSNPVNAAKLKLSVGGQQVYAAYFEGKMGYRNNSTSTGLAKGEAAETMYMVTSGKHYNGGCCFDYGNAETSTNDDGEGTMEALYFGTTSWGHGGGNGPWVMADLENGVWAGNTNPYAANLPTTHEYITAVLKGKAGAFALKAGDSQSGSMTTLYEGPLPVQGAWGGKYNPMRKEGAIILGVGGDNSNDGTGTFYEGCITTGYSSNETDEAVQANIVAAGYGR